MKLNCTVSSEISAVDRSSGNPLDLVCLQTALVSRLLGAEARSVPHHGNRGSVGAHVNSLEFTLIYSTVAIYSISDVIHKAGINPH